MLMKAVSEYHDKSTSLTRTLSLLKLLIPLLVLLFSVFRVSADEPTTAELASPPSVKHVSISVPEKAAPLPPAGVAWTAAQTQQGDKYSRFPHPLPFYALDEADMSLWQKLSHRMGVDPFNLAVSLCFLGAIIHTFLAPLIINAAHRVEKSRGHCLSVRILHVLGEIELIFALWVIPFSFVCISYYSTSDLVNYLGRDTNYTEPLFVATIMIIAASRPIYRMAECALQRMARWGKETPLAWWLTVLTVAPFFGSFITEPAAMTLAAIILSKKIYDLKPSTSFCYATLGLLFVNVSVGGTLTHFAAPPIVMVAGKWEWTLEFMMLNFGWKAMIGIVISNVIYYAMFRGEFARLADKQRALVAPSADQAESAPDATPAPIPLWVYLGSLVFLVFTVYFAHYPVYFLSGFAAFLLFFAVSRPHQEKLTIKIPLFVGIFLAGLLILGGTQGWWMQPVLQSLGALGEGATMALASVLTAFNDNAAVTFLASTVPNLADNMKYAIVAGAVTGGGLTVIANAPNLAGQSILSKHFSSINPLLLALWALLPTVIMFCMFYFL